MSKKKKTFPEHPMKAQTAKQVQAAGASTGSLKYEFVAEEQGLFNAGYALEIVHVPTGKSIAFPAYITDHSDAFTSNWTEETVYGRMDPIATFESTKRVASLGFALPAASREQAAYNLSKLNTLVSFLYPTYSERGVASDGTRMGTMNMGPLVRVKYANIITNPSSPSKGLLGYITTGITVTPDMEAGMFTAIRNEGGSHTQTGVKGNEILYKSYNLNFELTVLHEHQLGFVKATIKGSNKETHVWRAHKGAYPYNTNRVYPFTILGRASAGSYPETSVPQVPKGQKGATSQAASSAPTPGANSGQQPPPASPSIVRPGIFIPELSVQQMVGLTQMLQAQGFSADNQAGQDAVNDALLGLYRNPPLPLDIGE
mgnify:CR=1 FL=1